MCDLLPRFVHDALDNVETSLSLPILAVVVMCTLQFAICDSMHIICIVKDILRKKNRKCPKPKKMCCPGLFDAIIAMINTLINARPKCPERCSRKVKALCKRRCPKKRCNDDVSDDDEFDDGDDLLGLGDL